MDKKTKASFTLEATFVMSIVLFTMVFIIYLSFYLHDYSKVKAITDAVLHKATLNHKHEADIESGKINYDEINKGILRQMFGTEEKKEKETENYLRSLLSNSLLITKINDIQVSRDLRSISIRVEGSFWLPLRGIQKIFSGHSKLIIETDASYHYPADTVRMSEVLLDTGRKIKGIDKLKEIVEKLIAK